jgi:hypothetical protein
MCFAFFIVIISHFMRNGVATDYLGCLIVVVAVVILTTGVIYRAAVGLLSFLRATRPLTCIP